MLKPVMIWACYLQVVAAPWFAPVTLAVVVCTPTPLRLFSYRTNAAELKADPATASGSGSVLTTSAASEGDEEFLVHRTQLEPCDWVQVRLGNSKSESSESTLNCQCHAA